MKKIGVLVFLSLMMLAFFVRAADEPANGIDESDVDQIQQDIDTYIPINDDGNFDSSGYQSKAEERIAAINEYVGPITKTLWGVELSMSWIFLFSALMWILLIELIVTPVSEIFGYKLYVSLIPAGIIATLAMQGFGKDFVAWTNSIATGWTAGLTVLGLMIIVGIVYKVVLKLFGKKLAKMKKEKEKEQLDRDRAKIHADAEISEQKMKNEAESFSYKKGMKRGGINSRRERFVSKKSTERYAKMFGDGAANKRFGKKN